MNGGMGWREVRETVLARIRDGTWPPGSRIPDEVQLAAEFGCARSTVHRALRELAREGVLERRRRGGTRVPEMPVRRVTLGIPVLRREVEERGRRWGYRLLVDEPAPLPAGVAAALGLAPGTVWRRVRALHLADGCPFVLEDRWLDPAVAAGVSFREVSANEWLVRNVPLVEGTLAWSAEAAQGEDAALLGCAPGTPILVLERLTRGARGPITRVRLLYAPGFRLEGRL